MRARLLFTYPKDHIPDGTQIPFAPPLLIEDKNVGMFVSDWIRVFEATSLDAVTEEDIRKALNLQEVVSVYLPAARSMPNTDLYSEEVSLWRQTWWKETAAELRHQTALSKAS